MTALREKAIKINASEFCFHLYYCGVVHWWLFSSSSSSSFFSLSLRWLPFTHRREILQSSSLLEGVTLTYNWQQSTTEKGVFSPSSFSPLLSLSLSVPFNRQYLLVSVSLRWPLWTRTESKTKTNRWNSQFLSLFPFLVGCDIPNVTASHSHISLNKNICPSTRRVIEFSILGSETASATEEYHHRLAYDSLEGLDKRLSGSLSEDSYSWLASIIRSCESTEKWRRMHGKWLFTLGIFAILPIKTSVAIEKQSQSIKWSTRKSMSADRFQSRRRSFEGDREEEDLIESARSHFCSHLRKQQTLSITFWLISTIDQTTDTNRAFVWLLRRVRMIASQLRKQQDTGRLFISKQASVW